MDVLKELRKLAKPRPGLLVQGNRRIHLQAFLIGQFILAALAYSLAHGNLYCLNGISTKFLSARVSYWIRIKISLCRLCKLPQIAEYITSCSHLLLILPFHGRVVWPVSHIPFFYSSAV